MGRKFTALVSKHTNPTRKRGPRLRVGLVFPNQALAVYPRVRMSSVVRRREKRQPRSHAPSGSLRAWRTSAFSLLNRPLPDFAAATDNTVLGLMPRATTTPAP